MTELIRGKNVVEHLAPGSHASVVALVEGDAVIRVARPDDPTQAEWPARATAVRGMSHPSLVKLVGAKAPDPSTGEPAFIASKHIRGPLLSEVSSALEPDEADQVALQLAEGVAALHATGLVHGNIHAGQVRLADDGHAVLLDVAATWGAPVGTPSDDLSALASLALGLPLSAGALNVWRTAAANEGVTAESVVAALTAAPVGVAAEPPADPAPWESVVEPAFVPVDDSPDDADDLALDGEDDITPEELELVLGEALSTPSDVVDQTPAPAGFDPFGAYELDDAITQEPTGEPRVEAQPDGEVAAAMTPLEADSAPEADESGPVAGESNPDATADDTAPDTANLSLDGTPTVPIVPEAIAGPSSSGTDTFSPELIEARETAAVLAERLAQVQAEATQASASAAAAETLRQELAQAQAAQADLSSQVAVLTEQIEVAASDLATAHGELDAATAKVESLTAERERLSNELGQVSDELNAMRSTAESTSTAAAQVDAIKAELASTQAQLAAAREQVNSLTEQVAARARSAGEANARIAELTARCSYAEQQVAQLNAEVQAARGATGNVAELQSALADAQRRATAAETEREALRRLTVELSSKVAHPNMTPAAPALDPAVVTDLRRQLAEAQQRASAAEAEVMRARASLAAAVAPAAPAGPTPREEALAQEVASLRADLATATEEGQRLRQQVVDVSSAATSGPSAEVDELYAKIARLEAELARETARSADMTSQLTDLSVALAHAQAAARSNPGVPAAAPVAPAAPAPVMLPPSGPPLGVEAFQPPVPANAPGVSVTAPMGQDVQAAPSVALPVAPTPGAPVPAPAAPPAGIALPPVTLNDPPTTNFGASGGPQLLGLLREMQGQAGGDGATGA